MNGRRINFVPRSLSRPLTILGAERKLFFFAMCVGAGTFNLLGSLSWRVVDVSAALFPRSLGHENRSANPEALARFRQVAQPIRSRQSSVPSPCAG